jgi:ABC-type bacteriocin/lantibiotic exporter with double-glycine peptidase domain
MPFRRRLQLGVLTLLMLAAAGAEIVSLGAVLPFLGVLAAPERVMEYTVARSLAEALGVSSSRDLLFPFTVIFIAAALVSAGTRLLAMLAQVRMANAIGADFSIKAYERTLYQPYAVHTARNSSEIIAGIHKANALASTIIQPVLTVFSSSLILLCLLGAIVAINPWVALSVIVGFGLIYGVIITVTRRRLADVSRLAASQTVRITKAMQEGLGGIRDVLIDGSQATYARLYRGAIRPLQKAGAWIAFVDNSPRLCIEALGMVLIGSLAYSMARSSTDFSGPVVVLGSMALAAQRMLPVLQNLYANYIRVRSCQASVQDALDMLDQPLPAHALRPPASPLPLRQGIEIRDLAFRYRADTPWVLQGVDLRIRRGSRVGLIGSTGSGKSTLTDILMGLLQPVRGEILVDGTPVFPDRVREWQAHIAHVPQAIFLADVSIAENIAFGVPPEQIDLERVRTAARQAQIAEAIEAWAEGYRTPVGERGVRLSGGQRQRIGIARALYKRADVIFFDEATSALDNQTEAAVMDAIAGLSEDLTLVIVAHRLTTLRGCDCIVELEQGRVARVGSYQKIIGSRLLAEAAESGRRG